MIASPPTSAALDRRLMDNPRFVVPLLTVIIAALYMPIYRHDFVNWDDIDFICKNRWLNPVSLPNVLYFWGHVVDTVYQPLAFTVISLIACLARLPAPDPTISDSGSLFNPHIFHLASLILHIANTLLVYGILRTLVSKGMPSLLGALLFGLHPLQVEDVAWASGLDRLINGLFSLISLWLFMNWARGDSTETRNGRHWLLYCRSILCCALGYFAKPSAITLPLAALALDRLILGRPVRACLAAYAPWQALMAPLALVTILASTPTHPAVTPLWIRPLIALNGLAFYFGKLVAPFGLAIDYGVTPEWVAHHWIGSISWIVPAVVAVLAARCRPWLAAASLVTLAMLLPVLGLLPFGFETFSSVADRYMYLPMLGPALALAAYMETTSSRIVSAGAWVVLALYFGLSTAQISYWQNTETLMRHAAAVNPDSYPAANDLGTVLADHGQQGPALKEFDIAERIDPLRPDAHENAANALREMGLLDAACREYAVAASRLPNNSRADIDLGDTLSAMGRPLDAQQAYRNAIQKNPGNPLGYIGLARIATGSGDLQSAEADYRAATLAAPLDGHGHVFLIRVMIARGELNEAEAELDRTEKLPDRTPAFRGALDEIRRQLHSIPAWP